MRAVTLDELPALEGAAFGPSSWLRLEQGRIDTFAEATDDKQWIHVDPVASASGPFGRTIAHGYLTLSLVPHMMAELLDVECGQTINYGTEKVRFPAPVPTGSRIRLTLVIASVESIANGLQVGFQASVEREGTGKPVCVALVVYRFLR
jgi:acyl dehydratase